MWNLSAAQTAVFSVTAHTCCVSGSHHIIAERGMARSTSRAASAHRLPPHTIAILSFAFLLTVSRLSSVCSSLAYNDTGGDAKPPKQLIKNCTVKLHKCLEKDSNTGPQPSSTWTFEKYGIPFRYALAKVMVSLPVSLTLLSNMYANIHVRVHRLSGIANTVMFENHCSRVKYNVTGADLWFSADLSRPRHVLYK